MSQLGQIYSITTDPSVDFLPAISSGAQLIFDWRPDLGVSGIESCRLRVCAVAMVSVQNLDWELWFWRKAAGPGATIDANSFVGFIPLPAAGAKQIGGTGLWYYFLPINALVMDLPYTDDDETGVIHLGLRPTSGGKLFGGAGQVKITLNVDNTHG